MVLKYHTDKYHTVLVRYGILKVRYGILSKIILKNTIPYKYSMAFLKYGMVFSKNRSEKYHTVQVQYGIIKVRYGIFRNHLEKYHTVQVQYGIFLKMMSFMKIPYRTCTVWHFFESLKKPA